MLSRQFLALPHDARDASVVKAQVPLPAALAPEAEPQFPAFDPHMAPAQRSQSEAAVGARIFGIADPDQGFFKQVDHGGQNLLARETGQAHMRVDSGTNSGKPPREVQHVRVLRLIAPRPEILVIDVLLATAGIPSRCLDMPIAPRTYPNFGPRRRYGERPDPPER